MLSVPHLIIIFLVALVVFGPEKLPELARNFGKVMAEFRRATGDLRSTFEEHMRDLEREADDRRIGPGHPQATEPFTVTGGSSTAPDHVIASTPLSARVRSDVSAAVADGENSVSNLNGDSGEPPPSIGEASRKRLAGATESVLDPAVSLAPASTVGTEQPAENGTNSGIVTDGHRSS
ncbi:MAG TPA: twin-arginine translocase TatA/TatE family subunit [Candidatus Acidoferrum sp.]|nr:twin-arginine translocase TatA/TatE family subunit [Candidatus Acidoferrum sp.]